MDRELKTLSLEVKDLSESGSFNGLLSVYDVVDSYNDVVERGAYTKTLKENGGRVPMLWQHDAASPIGWLYLSDGETGLEAKGELLLKDEVPLAKTAYELLKAGIVKGLSIGFKALRSDPKQAKEGQPRRLKEIKLFEGSLVTFGACPGAIVQQVKAAGIETKDFASELNAIEVYARHYQMLQALNYALDRIRYADMGRESALASVRATLDQFVEAYWGYFPSLLELWNVKEAPKLEFLNTIPPEARIWLAEYSKSLLQPADSHPGTLETSAASAAEPAIKPKGDAPDPLHSLLNGFGQRVGSALLAN